MSISTSRAAPTSAEKRFHAVDFAAAFSLVALRVAPLPIDGKIGRINFVCPFLGLTGLPCPFCGLTRSAVYSAHFQFDQALQYHVLGPLLFAVLLTSSTRLLVAIVGSKFSPRTTSLLWNTFIVRTFVGRMARCKIPRRAMFTDLAMFTALLWIARLAGLLPLPHGVS